jgi:hypothetical protein
LAIRITCADAVDFHGGEVCVQTHPGAQLTITVTYCSGKMAKSASLGPATADANGSHRWTWVPDTTCKGTATASVSADWNGQSAFDSKTFMVS